MKKFKRKRKEKKDKTPVYTCALIEAVHSLVLRSFNAEFDSIGTVDEFKVELETMISNWKFEETQVKTVIVEKDRVIDYDIQLRELVASIRENITNSFKHVIHRYYDAYDTVMINSVDKEEYQKADHCLRIMSEIIKIMDEHVSNRDEENG